MGVDELGWISTKPCEEDVLSEELAAVASVPELRLSGAANS